MIPQIAGINSLCAQCSKKRIEIRFIKNRNMASTTSHVGLMARVIATDDENDDGEMRENRLIES